MQKNSGNAQVQDPAQPVIERISRLSNFDDAASLILELRANRDYWKAIHEEHSSKPANKEIPSPLERVGAELRKKLVELQGGEKWDVRGAIDALCRRGETRAGAVGILLDAKALQSLPKTITSQIGQINEEYSKAGSREKKEIEEQILGIFSRLGSLFYRRADESNFGNDQYETEFLENETCLSFCALLSEKNPELLRHLAMTPKMEFSYFGGEKISILDFFGSRLNTDLPESIAVKILPALGGILSQDQDEKAKNLLLSYLSRLLQDKDARPILISQTLCAAEEFFLRSSPQAEELELAREGVIRVILSGDTEAQKHVIYAFLRVSDPWVSTIFKMVGSSAIDAILEMEPVKDKELLLLCQQALLKYRYEPDSFEATREQYEKIDSYFNSLFERALSLGPKERFELLGGLLSLDDGGVFLIDRANERLIVQLAYDLLVMPEEIGVEGRGRDEDPKLNEIYTAVLHNIELLFFRNSGFFSSGTVLDEGPVLFGERVFEDLQGRERITGASPNSYKKEQDAREKALSSLFLFMLRKYSTLPEQEKQEKIGKLSRLAIDSKVSRELFARGLGLKQREAHILTMDSYFMKRVYEIGRVEPVPILVDFLKRADFGWDVQRNDQRAYETGLNLASKILSGFDLDFFQEEDEQKQKRREMMLSDRELYEHLFSLYQQETDAGRRAKLASVLVYFEQAQDYFEKMLFKKNTPEEVRLEIIRVFTQDRVEIRDKERLYELVNEEGLKAETRRAALYYVSEVVGHETAQELAVGLLRNEDIDLLERREALLGADGYFETIEVWNKYLADYMLSRLESEGVLSQRDLMLCFSTAIYNAGRVDKYSKEDYESLSGRLFSAAKRRFFELEDNRVLMACGAFSMHDDYDKSELIIGGCEPGILSYMAGTFGLEGLRTLNDIMEEMKEKRIPISQEVAYYVNRTSHFTITEKCEQEYAERTIPLLDGIFSINHLPGVYIQHKAERPPGGRTLGKDITADEQLALYVRNVLPFPKTKAVEDKFDPVSRQVRIRNDAEISRLLSELSGIASVHAQRPGERYGQYALQIAEALDNRFQYFVLNREQEDVLFEAGKRFLSEGQTSIDSIIHVLMRNPRDNQKRVEDFLLAGVGTRGEDFERGRIHLLGKIDSPRVNSALDSFSRDTSLAGGARAAAVDALYWHGEKIDEKLLTDSNVEVRKYAAMAYESNLAEGADKAVKDAEQSLDPQIQTPGVVRERMAGAVARANIPESERLLGEGLKKETWGTDAAGREYFAVEIELPLVNRVEEEESPERKMKGKIKQANYAKTAKVGFLHEGGGKEIISAKEVGMELEKALDEEMPLFLSSMGFERGTIDSIMTVFGGVEINHITSESGILGGEAFGVHRVETNAEGSQTHRIDLDMDEIEKTAKGAGFHTKYMYYDVLHHEMMHAVSNTPGVTNQVNGHNAMHGYLVLVDPFSPPIPLDEPLTEFFTTMFEIYGAEAKKAASGQEGEFDEHARKIGLSYDQIIRQMNDAYGAIAQSRVFLDWMQGVGTQKVFDCYVRGDLDRLISLTEDRFGYGSFERVFPRFGR